MGSESEVYDLIIIGGGPAGLTAGLYAMRAVLKTILVEKATPGGQVAITKGVENYPGFEEISGLELCDKFLHHAQSYGLELIRDEVISIQPGVDLHTVSLESGKVLRGHAVIIATGGTPRKLGVPGEDELLGRGVSYCAKCDGFFFQDRVVSVVGGGDTALEDALYLTKLASKVYLIHRRNSFRASKILQKRVAESGIELVLDSVITRINDQDNAVNSISVKNIVTGEQRIIETEGVFIFVGLFPNNRTAPGTPLPITVAPPIFQASLLRVTSSRNTPNRSWSQPGKAVPQLWRQRITSMRKKVKWSRFDRPNCGTDLRSY